MNYLSMAHFLPLDAMIIGLVLTHWQRVISENECLSNKCVSSTSSIQREDIIEYNKLNN